MEDIAISLATSIATSLVIETEPEYDFVYDFETISAVPFEITGAEEKAILDNRRVQMNVLSVNIKGSYMSESFHYTNSQGLPYDFDLVGWKSTIPVVQETKYAKFSYDEGTDKWYFTFDV